MASSSATQVRVLGKSTPFSTTPNGSSSSSSRTVFFGLKLNTSGSGAPYGRPSTLFFKSNNTSRRRNHVFQPQRLRIVNEKVVGIDLGTTNSAVAAMEGGKPTIVTNAEGQRTTPSVVAYSKNGEKLVGQIAKRQAVVNPENTFYSVKRFIGSKIYEVDEEAKQVSYKVVGDENGNVKLVCPALGKLFAPEEISAQ